MDRSVARKQTQHAVEARKLHAAVRQGLSVSSHVAQLYDMVYQIVCMYSRQFVFISSQYLICTYDDPSCI